MTIVDVVAVILFVGVVAYACFGGADFGSGVWDLTAGNADRGGAMRKLVDRAIGPVWEANHVWLIFVLVYLWTGFPTAFASMMETLYIPFLFAGLGIVLRGATFVFRKFAPTVEQARFFGVLFALSSIVTPFFFGTIAGAIASGRVPASGTGDVWASWTGPSSIIGGVLAVLTCAFLAAVFLTAEAARGTHPDPLLIAACRRRAVGTGVVTGVAALAFLLPLKHDAGTLFSGLTGRGFLVILISALAGAGTIVLLQLGRYAASRATALIAVAAVISGWGVGQYPWMLVDQAKLADAAGANATLWALVVAFGVIAVTVVPSLVYLYFVTQTKTWAAGEHA